MLDIVYSKQFKTDFKKIKNDTKAKQCLQKVLSILANGQDLPAKYRPHALTGNYSNYMECHIKPDLLLIYRIKNDELVLYLLRVGSHSALFQK